MNRLALPFAAAFIMRRTLTRSPRDMAPGLSPLPTPPFLPHAVELVSAVQSSPRGPVARRLIAARIAGERTAWPEGMCRPYADATARRGPDEGETGPCGWGDGWVIFAPARVEAVRGATVGESRGAAVALEGESQTSRWLWVSG